MTLMRGTESQREMVQESRQPVVVAGADDVQ